MLIGLLILLILCSAWLSASETALFSLSSMKVRSLQKGEDHRGKLIAQLLGRPRELLVTILMVNVLMNLLVQNVVSGIFGTFSGWGLTVGIPLGLTLIFGEVLPKSVAYSKNAWIAYRVAPLIHWIARIIKPLRRLLTKLTSGISRCLFFYLQREKEISIEELKHALRTSRDTGMLDPEEAKLVRGYLNLEEDLIKELMCPRQDIRYFDLNEPLEKLVALFVDEECSRVPVCKGGLENLLGIATSASFFLHKKHIQHAYDLVPFLQSPQFVPESMPGRILLNHFYDKEETMMVVVDEYGSISGLITLEDLVEVVVGQIADRRSEKSAYTRASEDILIASGKLELGEFEQIFDVHLESPNNMATIGGWLTEQLGDIPKSGIQHMANGFLFHILSADYNRVRRVYIRRLKPAKKKGSKKERE
ncbi:MAG: hemolysin family protein [Chlamydiota bacterium]